MNSRQKDKIEYKSLFEIKKMINILVGFNEEQIKLILDIAEKSFKCGQKRIDKLILELSGEDTLKEAEEYFEIERYKHYLPRTKLLFKVININQLAILFKLKGLEK